MVTGVQILVNFPTDFLVILGNPSDFPWLILLIPSDFPWVILVIYQWFWVIPKGILVIFPT